MKKYSLMSVLAVLIMSVPLMAQRPPKVENEDMQFIREWRHSQMIAGLAENLALTTDQLATLRATRAEIDAIKAEYQPQQDALIADLEAAAAQARANIEATDALAEDDITTMRGLKARLGDLRRAERGAIGEAVSGLEGLLTEEQIQVIKDSASRRGMGMGLGQGQSRGKRDGLGQGRGKRGGEGRADRGGKRGEEGRADRGGRRGHRGKARVARILLSDEFLAQYQ